MYDLDPYPRIAYDPVSLRADPDCVEKLRNKAQAGGAAQGVGLWKRPQIALSYLGFHFN